MRARSILLRVAVATSTIAALTLGAGLPAHAAPPGLQVNDVSVVEGNAGTSFATFTIKYSGPGTAGVSVDYATANETATAGSDYTATSGTVALPSGGCKCTTVNVPILGDTTVEANETFEVNLSNPVGKTITDGQGIGTITNDDLPSASIDDPTVAENGGTMTFTVSLDSSSPTDAVMTYATAAGTATAGSDYTTTTGTFTILAGSTTGTINVPILDDAVFEGDETLTMNLVALSGVTIGDAQGLGTITENEPQPSITVDDPTVSENGGTMTFTISLDAAAAVDVSVDYATSDNTATDGQDYTGQSGTATILAGATTTTVDVPVLDDNTYEGDENLNLDLTGAVNGSVVDAQGQGTIQENDAAPTISVDSPSVGEGGGTLTFTISIDAAAAVDTSVDYATSDGSATDGQDYTGQTGTATILAGATTTTVDVPVLDDSTYEGDETVHLDLSNPVNGQGSPNGTGTIQENDAAPTISVDSPSVGEGGGTLTFTISIDAAAAVDTKVDYATSNGTATHGQDFTTTQGTATITAGSTSTTVNVPVLDDAVHEADETFSLDLSNPVDGQGTPSGTATITDDDEPDVSIADANVLEGNSGTADLTFGVTLSNASSTDVSVHYATSDGSATAGSDYTSASGTLTIPAGSTTGTVTVHAKGDTTFEPDETVTVTLSGLVGGTSITNDTATGTIRNDDKQPSTLSMKVGKTHKNVGARGLLEPASIGNTVTVTLAKYSHRKWHTVQSKTVTVKKLADRDGDGQIDAKYGARFKRPSHGRYRLTASFGGDGNTSGKSKAERFKL